MKGLRQFAKLVFICNIMFALFAAIQITGDFIKQQFITSFIIALGYPAIIINAILQVTMLFVVLIKRRLGMPVWLYVINLLFFAAQIIYFFFFVSNSKMP